MYLLDTNTCIQIINRGARKSQKVESNLERMKFFCAPLESLYWPNREIKALQ